MKRLNFTGLFILALEILELSNCFWKNCCLFSHPVSEFCIEIAKFLHFQISYCIPTNTALSFPTTYLIFAETHQLTAGLSKLRELHFHFARIQEKEFKGEITEQ